MSKESKYRLLNNASSFGSLKSKSIVMKAEQDLEVFKNQTLLLIILKV